jgi:hypothetical protein
MASAVPSEFAIEREMAETGLDRLPAIRRIQQRAVLTRRAVSRAPDGDPLYFVRPGERV